MTRMAPSSASPCRRGAALLVATAAMVVVAGLVLAMLDSSMANLRQEQARERRHACQLAAESAANIALAAMRMYDFDLALVPEAGQEVDLTRRAPDGTSQVVTGPDPMVNQARVSARASRIPGEMAWLLVATAEIGSAADPMHSLRHRVEMRLRRVPASINGKGLLADWYYYFGGSASTDSWDSAMGIYAAADHSGAPGTTGVRGDIYSRHGAPEVRSGDLKGRSFNTNDPMPTVTFPDPMPGTPIYPTRRCSMTLTGPGIYNVSGPLPDMDLTIDGPGDVHLYVDGPIDLASPIIYAAGSVARLWIHQSDNAGSSSTLNGNAVCGSLADPSRLIIMSTFSGDLTLNGTADLGAIMVFPYATVKLRGNANFYGCLWCERMEMDRVVGNYAFHYDEALDNFRLPLPPMIVVDGWRSFPVAWSNP